MCFQVLLSANTWGLPILVYADGHIGCLLSTVLDLLSFGVAEFTHWQHLVCFVGVLAAVVFIGRGHGGQA
jgi:hypothetical protein